MDTESNNTANITKIDFENGGIEKKKEIKRMMIEEEFILMHEIEDDISSWNEKDAPKRKNTDLTAHMMSIDSSDAYVPGEELEEESDNCVDNEKGGVLLKKPEPRCCRPSKRCCKRCFCTGVALILIAGLSLLATIFLGSRLEERRYAKASNTLNLYASEAVCALEDVDQTLSTFSTAQAANDAGLQVAHCGTCGGCSSVQDMTIYARTRNTLTVDATKCAMKSFFSLDLVGKCFDHRVGFTPSCRDCWKENISCTKKLCKWTCLKFKMWGQGNNDEESGALNKCLLCDERMCGPAFLECAGANRRQSGIISAIGRDAEKEQCHSVDIDWVGSLNT